MLSKILLKFETDDLYHKYQEDQISITLRELTLYSICQWVFVIMEVVSAIQAPVLVMVDLLFPLSYIILSFGFYLLHFKQRISITYIQVALQVVDCLLQFLISQQIFLIPRETFINGYAMSLLSLGLLLQGNNYWLSCATWIGTNMYRSAVMRNNVTSYLQFISVSLFFLYLRFDFEKVRRFSFSYRHQNNQWIRLIEEILPVQTIILRFNKVFSQIQIEFANRPFLKRLEVQNDQQIRALLRRMFIYREEQIIKREAQERINIESEIINLMTGRTTEEQSTSYIGIQSLKERKKVYRINMMSLDHRVLLLFSEISGTKIEEQQHQIQWRDKYLEKLVQSNMRHYTRIIAFLKQLTQRFTEDSFRDILKAQIQQSYICYNTLLNTETHLKTWSNCVNFNITLFNADHCFDQLIQDFKFRYQLETQQSILLNTDKQKLIQIILSFIEFIQMLLDKDEVMPLTLSVAPYYDDRVVFKFFHPHLCVEEKLQEALAQHTPVSMHNRHRWGQNENFAIIQRLTDSLSPFLRGDSTQMVPSGIPTALFLISQLGPYNQLFFKEKTVVKRGRNLEQFDLHPIRKPNYLNINHGQSQPLIPPDNSLMPSLRSFNEQGSGYNLISNQQIPLPNTQALRSQQVSQRMPANQIKFFIYRDMQQFLNSQEE